ncbi:MAG: TatD family hydrolase [Tepidisphaerales bacterium]
MKLIDPHIHCVSRTTDDYLFMSRCGVVAVTEPAFWAGFDRSSAASFYDYFRHLTDVEPKRAARYGIAHYAWLCINAKEADNLSLAREVIKLIPPLLDHPRVLGIGEIGLNKNTRNEITIFEEQVDLAARFDQLILIHTPHLVDKHKGTSIICSVLKNDRRIRPERVLIDHCEEHTLRMAREHGFWAGLTIYPVTKMTPQRAVDLLEQYGPQQMCINSASDWGESGPHTLVDTLRAFRERGHGEDEATEVFYNNPCRFFGQCPKWSLRPTDTALSHAFNAPPSRAQAAPAATPSAP